MPLFPSPRPQHRPLAGIVPSLGACGTDLLAWYFAPCPAGAKARRVYKRAGRKTSKFRTAAAAQKFRDKSDFACAGFTCRAFLRGYSQTSTAPARIVQRGSQPRPPSQRQRRIFERCPATTRRQTAGEPRKRQRKVLETLVSKRRFGDFAAVGKVTRPAGRNHFNSLVSFTRNSVISSSFIPREALTRKVESF